MSKKFLYPFILILSMIVVSTSIYLYHKIHQPPPDTKATTHRTTPTITPESTLKFSPETILASRREENEVDIQINTIGQAPNLIQLELAYDPSFISQISLSPGSLFSNPAILLNNTDPNTGRISYALTDSSNTILSQTSGTVARLKFTLKPISSLNQSAIYFLPKTAVKSQNSVIPLKIAHGLKIQTLSPLPPASSSANTSKP